MKYYNELNEKNDLNLINMFYDVTEWKSHAYALKMTTLNIKPMGEKQGQPLKWSYLRKKIPPKIK